MRRGLAVGTTASVTGSKQIDPELLKIRLTASCRIPVCLKSGSGWSLASHWCETNAALPNSSLKITSSPLAFKGRRPKILRLMAFRV